MRLLLLCIGRLKAGPERDLVARYIDRAAAAGRAIGFSPLIVRETAESRAPRAADRRQEEARALAAQLPPGALVIALDETGAQMRSRDLAARLGRARDDAISDAAFVIGGPDGLDPAFLASVAVTLSFGTMTWPHQLVRIMATEQVYRAMTILSGHPYHRD